MSRDDPPENLMTVRTDLVREHLVGSLLAAAQKRRGEPLPAEIERAIENSSAVRTEVEITRLGYLGRIAETEVFEAASAPMPWLERELAVREAGDQWPAAATELSLELAATEPDSRPAPGGDAASWRVPGPGGHVRHYVAAAVLDSLAGTEDEHQIDASSVSCAADLKRRWLFGFMLRCCEERRPDPPAVAGR